VVDAAGAVWWYGGKACVVVGFCWTMNYRSRITEIVLCYLADCGGSSQESSIWWANIFLSLCFWAIRGGSQGSSLWWANNH
jgi:hypothetical protein